MPEHAATPTLADVTAAARDLLHHEDRAATERDLLDRSAPLTLAEEATLADVAYASADACVARAHLHGLLDHLEHPEHPSGLSSPRACPACLPDREHGPARP